MRHVPGEETVSVSVKDGFTAEWILLLLCFFIQTELRMSFYGRGDDCVIALENITGCFSTDSTGRTILNREADIPAQRISFLFVPIQRV